jgi:hypothetical protein
LRDTAAHVTPPHELPGDEASPVDIARWMANWARESALPPELPIMAALVSSG